MQAWEKLWRAPEIAARRSACFEHNPYYAATWIRMGEIEALEMQCTPTDKSALNRMLPALRSLTKEKADVFTKEMVRLCQEVGVALVLVPEFPKLTWHGATKWLDNTAMIMLNLRGKKEDIFWFTFFHEIYHVLHSDKRELCIHDVHAPAETIANDFAAKVLFKTPEMRVRIGCAKSEEELRQIAQELDISLGIVAGQHRYLTKNYAKYGALIQCLQWQKKA